MNPLTIRTRALLATAAMVVVAVGATAQPAGTVRELDPRSRPNLELSAAFAPTRFVINDAAAKNRLERYLLRESGSAGEALDTFAVRGNTVKLSRRWISRLAAEDSIVDGGRNADRRARAKRRLERVIGGTIEEAGVAFPAGYLPADASYIHVASLQEESSNNCRQKTMWAYLDTSVLCDHAAGAGINMAPVWDRFDGADTLVIAVLDAGFDFLHHDLQGRWAVNLAEANGLPGVDDDGNGFVDDIRGWDFVDNDNDAQDYNGHGTMISGVIAAGFENGIGIPGMLPRVKILPVRVLSTSGFGTTDAIAAGIHYAVARGAHVINFSIGINTTGTNTTLRNAFIAARNAGVIVAAATGNNGIDIDANPRQPFSYGYDNVYGIAASNQSKGMAGFSNYGATKADLAAPGVNIVTTAIPPALTSVAETFESFTGARWSWTGTWQVANDTMQGTKSLQWVTGNTTTVTLDSVDLRGKRGGLLTFRLTLQPANSRDGLDVYVLPAGSSTPIPIGGYGEIVNNQTVSINLGAVDNAQFQLSFRACVFNTIGTACSGTASAAGRVLRIDDVRITYADLDSSKHDVVTVTGGTSLAAPYFAGYAGLMRLASDRMGVPLTRSLMLAGVQPESALAGKVATGGRLDAAKGLDFYLRTLPRITVNDSLDTTWSSGAAVAYALTVRDSLGPRGDFAFSPIGLPPGGTLSSSGLFAWNSAASPQGHYTVRAKAENGTHTLRSLTNFTIGMATPIHVAAPGQASRLRVGGRVFVLPPSVFTAAGSAPMLRLELYAADGKLLRKLDGPLTVPSGARVVEYQITGVQSVGARAWLNGTLLQPARD